MMNIYLLDDENVDVGFSSFLIVANDEEEARTMARNYVDSYMSCSRDEAKLWISEKTSCVKIGNDENIYDEPKIINDWYEYERW